MGLTFRLFGPPTASRDDRPLPVARGRQLALLHTLLVNPNRVVAVPELVDELWGGSPPPSAVANLRSYINRLRKLLDAEGDPAHERLISHNGGYLLRVTPDQLDAASFERLVTEAHAERARGSPAAAAPLLERALSMWPDAVPSPTGGPQVTAALDRLLQRRIWAAEEYFTCRLQTWDGDIASLTDALRRHVGAYPLRERGWAQLMTVLYRIGDPAGALDAFHEARRRLKVDLGISPGQELCRLQRAILDRSPELLHPRQRRPPVPAAGAATPATVVRQRPTPLDPVPHELPDTACCIGRQQELGQLAGRLREVTDKPVCLAVYGAPGTGKSTLAARAAGTAARHYPDGQLYLDLNGSQSQQPPLSAAEIATRLLRSLNPDTPPASATAQRTRLRSLLYGRRMLILLDNAVNAAQLAGLLPARGGCALLVTSRSMLVAVDAHHLRVGRLSRSAAIALLGHNAGPQRIAAEPAAAAEVVDLCDRLPLAVRIAACRLARHPYRRVADLADLLRDEQYRLDVLTNGTMSVRASLSVSYAALGDSVARHFRRLGRARLPRLTPRSVGALLGVDPDTAAASLDQLSDAQLIEPAGCGGYRMPTLVRLYAAELSTTHPPT